MTDRRRQIRPGLPVRVIFPEVTLDCDVCGELIEPGTVAVMGETELSHELCPVRWTPTVIEGNATAGAQPSLRFLTAAPDPEGAP